MNHGAIKQLDRMIFDSGLIDSGWFGLGPIDTVLFGASTTRWRFEQTGWTPWMIGLAVIIGCVLGGMFFYRGERLSARRRYLLGALRGLAMGLIAWMLWGMMLSRWIDVRPELWILVDASESMQVEDVEASGRSRWNEAWGRLEDPRLRRELESRYSLRFFRCGAGLAEIQDRANESNEEKAGPSEQESRIGDDLATALASGAGEGIAGIWLLSDGRGTAGKPLKGIAGVNPSRIPIHVTPTGSVRPEPDLLVESIDAPSVVIPGDWMDLTVKLRSSEGGPSPPSVRVRLENDRGEVLDEEAWTGERAQEDLMVRLGAAVQGRGASKFRVVADTLPGELVVDNNAMEFSVQVREEPLRVLLIAGGPSYEFRFLKHLLERSIGKETGQPWLQLISVLQDGDPRYADQDRTAARLPPVDEAALDGIDVFVLLDVDAQSLGRLLIDRMVERVDKRGAGLLVVAGEKSVVSALATTSMGKVLPADPQRFVYGSIQDRGWRARLTPFGGAERSFQLPDRLWEQMPAVTACVHVDRASPASQVWLEGVSERGSIEPLVMVQRVGAGTVQMHLTDELYRLVSTGANDQAHEWFWLQSVRRLARGRQAADPDRIELKADPRTVEPGESARLIAFLGEHRLAEHNGLVEVRLTPMGLQNESESSGLPREPISMKVDRDDPQRWSVQIPDLEPGRWRAELLGGDGDQRVVEAETELRVRPPITERTRTEVDLEGLLSVASDSGGNALALDEDTETWTGRFPQVQPLRSIPQAPEPIWNHPLVIFAVLGLLIVEWGARRFWGLV